jgi:hypothetical protein
MFSDNPLKTYTVPDVDHHPTHLMLEDLFVPVPKITKNQEDSLLSAWTLTNYKDIP